MTNIRKKIKLYTLLPIFAFAAVALGAGAIGSKNASAEEYKVSSNGDSVTAEPSFSVTVPEVNALEITLPSRVVAIDVSPTPNTPSFASTDIDIKVGTTNETGYTLTMTPVYNNVITSNLTRTEAIDGSTPTIETLAAKDGGYTSSEFENSSDTVNAWGYMLSDSHLTTTNYMPVEAGSMKLNNYFSPVDNDPTTVTLAAKVSAVKPAGEYQTTLKFTATANPVTYAINFNKGRAAAGTTVPDPLTGAMNSSATTPVSLNGSEPGTWTGYAFTGWCSVSPTLDGNSDKCPEGASSYSSSSEVTMTPDKDIITLYAMWSVRSFGINIKSSTGISKVTLSKGGSTVCEATTTSSVSCGELPYGTTYDLVATANTGYTFNGWTLDPNDGTLGNRTSASTTFTVGTQGTLISPSAQLNSYTVTVTFAGAGLNSVAFYNATYGTSTATNNNAGGAGTGTATLYYNVPYTATAAFASNHEIVSWASGTNTGVSATTATNPITVTLTGAGNGTLTVTGKSSKAYMQDFTKAMCQTNASSANYTVYDRRDENSYNVRYINGNCWMVQNLRFSGTSIDSTNTNINTSKTISWSDLTSGNTYDAARYHNSGNASNGYWYNYAGASAMTITGSSNSTEASYDICPSGWRLPTNSEFSGITSQKDAFQPVTGGYYYNGSVSNTGYGYWWSSTAGSTTSRYYLLYSGSSLSTTYFDRQYGNYVRCIRKS